MGVEVLALDFDSAIIKVSAWLLQNHSNLQLIVFHQNSDFVKIHLCQSLYFIKNYICFYFNVKYQKRLTMFSWRLKQNTCLKQKQNKHQPQKVLIACWKWKHSLKLHFSHLKQWNNKKCMYSEENKASTAKCEAFFSIFKQIYEHAS